MTPPREGASAATLRDLPVTLGGGRGALFRLAVRTSVLTILTLGLYRFWMKTRLRRWYWSSVRPGGLPLEYTGEPLEKLLGFLIAVVVLAFYIGLVNLVLVFVSLSFFQGMGAAYAVSFAGLLPILFFARYRARRYVVGRTRWRGIRLSMEPAAWGYAWRALAHWAVTILSLGILWPRMTFWLEKYRTDRTRYGALRITQGGHWRALYPAARHVIIGALLAASGALGLAGLIPAPVATLEPDPDLRAFYAGLLLVAGAVWFAVGVVYYRVHSFRILTGGKLLEGGAGLVSSARTGRVLAIYVFGHLAAALALMLLLLPVSVLVLLLPLDAIALLADDVARGSGDGALALDLLAGLPLWLSAAVGVATYFAFFVVWGALRQVFVTLPLIRHYAQTLVVVSPLPLMRARQTARDVFADAEGFADALDLGAAI